MSGVNNLGRVPLHLFWKKIDIQLNTLYFALTDGKAAVYISISTNKKTYMHDYALTMTKFHIFLINGVKIEVSRTSFFNCSLVSLLSEQPSLLY